MLLEIVLLAVSFLAAGYQDFKERMVSDIVWIPGAIGVVITLVFVPSQDLLLIIRLVAVGVVAFVVTRYGFLGEADGIAFVLLMAIPSPFDLFVLLFSIAFVALGAIGYVYATGMAGKDRIIPISQFRAEARWIPKAVIVGGERKDVDKNVNLSREDVDKVTDDSAMVEVQYGVPNVEYIAIGYVVFVCFLAIYQRGVLLSFP